MFQIWKRETPLDRNLLLCEAAGGEVHQVNAARTIRRQTRLMQALNECVFLQPHAEDVLHRLLLTRNHHYGVDREQVRLG